MRYNEITIDEFVGTLHFARRALPNSCQSLSLWNTVARCRDASYFPLQALGMRVRVLGFANNAAILLEAHLRITCDTAVLHFSNTFL